MLTAAPGERSRRSPRSLQAEYHQFIEQRIEEYKDSLPRAHILAIGDEAVQELARSEQIQLTEVVLREQVDAIIRRRLKLPSFRRWREKHLALRAAQAEPSHWGLDAHDPVVLLAELVEENDVILAVGAGDGACALFLAARGAFVRVVDPDLAAVYGLESRAITEALGGKIECEVTPLVGYTPEPGSFMACVIEAGTAADLRAAERTSLIGRLKDATPQGGRHVVMPVATEARAPLNHVSSDALRTLYAGWTVILPPAAHGGRRPKNTGFVAVRDAVAAASE